jgi:tRNA(Arg) A34 adenosine deaminase TadA
MKERFFKFAREASREASYTGTRSSPAIGAICEYKGTIIGEACNSNKTSPLQARYNIYRYNDDNTAPKIHAEIALLQKIRWRFGDSIDWSKVHFYIYREYKNGELANSRPCPSCLEAMRQHGIKKFAYTTENGYAEEKFRSP